MFLRQKLGKKLALNSQNLGFPAVIPQETDKKCQNKKAWTVRLLSRGWPEGQLYFHEGQSISRV